MSDKPTAPITPDENPAVEPQFDTIVGEFANSLLHDLRMLEHQHAISPELAANWMQFSGNIINMFDGPLYVEEKED